jgi:hypothetical protein
MPYNNITLILLCYNLRRVETVQIVLGRRQKTSYSSPSGLVKRESFSLRHPEGTWPSNSGFCLRIM